LSWPERRTWATKAFAARITKRQTRESLAFAKGAFIHDLTWLLKCAESVGWTEEAGKK
jgi:hypothetical protein